MNKTIQFALMMAVVAAVGIATTAVMSPISAHADQPRYCYNNGDGTGLHCTTSQTKCEKLAENDQQCQNNRG